MSKDDRVTFARGFYALGAAFSESVSELKAEAYFDALSDLDVAAVLDAMRTSILECRFFPRPVELRERIYGKPEDRAEIAWNAVLTLVRRIGWCGSPDGQWPDLAMQRAALELFGGWRALCEQLPAGGPELLGYRKAFLASYVAYAHRDWCHQVALPPISREEAKQLLGDLDAHVRTIEPSEPSAVRLVKPKRTQHAETSTIEQIRAWRATQPVAGAIVRAAFGHEPGARE